MNYIIYIHTAQAADPRTDQHNPYSRPTVLAVTDTKDDADEAIREAYGRMANADDLRFHVVEAQEVIALSGTQEA